MTIKGTRKLEELPLRVFPGATDSPVCDPALVHLLIPLQAQEAGETFFRFTQSPDYP